MPELPEVETIRRGLNRKTCHKAIAGGEILRSKTIAHPDNGKDFLRAVTGSQIQQWQRRGKYLLAVLQKQGKAAGWLGVHLRMTGQLLWLDSPDPPPSVHTRLRLYFQGNSAPVHGAAELRFVDIRTFGQIWWIPPEVSPETIIPTLARLGPEPLSPDFTPDYLHDRLRKTQRSLKTALLDQTVVAGLGNIYVDECLFLSGLHPQPPANRLGFGEVQQLRDAIVTILQAGIEAGGTTLRDYRTVEGINGNYSQEAWVYRRTGLPCRQCQTPIERIKLAGRSTHFCPHCQNVS